MLKFKDRELSYEDMRNMTEAEIIAHSNGRENVRIKCIKV